MMKKLLTTILMSAVLVWATDIFAAGSSRPSGSSSRPSSSSSRPSTSSSRPSSSSSRPSTSSSRPSSSSSKPSGSSSKPSGSTSSGSSSYKPSSSSKPSSSFDSNAGNAQSRSESRSRYEAASRPKESYTTSTGKSVKIDSNSPSVQTIRSRVNNHDTYVTYKRTYVTHYESMPRYSYYSSLPAIYVGPGHYSHLFWYSTFDWALTTQALWLYHHQNSIDSQLWQQRMQNAALRAEVEKLKAQGIRQDPNYVPADYKGKEHLMYDPEYVAASANMQEESGVKTFFKVFFVILIIAVIIGIIFWLVAVKKWNY